MWHAFSLLIKMTKKCLQNQIKLNKERGLGWLFSSGSLFGDKIMETCMKKNFCHNFIFLFFFIYNINMS